MSRLVPRAFKKVHVNPPSDPGEGSGRTGLKVETLITLQAALTILKDSIDGLPIPGLKASLSGLLSVITATRVCLFYPFNLLPVMANC